MRRWTFAAAAALVVGLVAPASHADTVLLDCMGTAPTDGTGSCTSTVEVEDLGRRVSPLFSHANFHTVPSNPTADPPQPAGSPVTYGTITMTWRDGGGAVVGAWTCRGLGVNADGYTDLTILTCQETVAPGAYAIGTHTLTVTATEVKNCGARDCAFHGRLALRSADDPI